MEEKHHHKKGMYIVCKTFIVTQGHY